MPHRGPSHSDGTDRTGIVGHSTVTRMCIFEYHQESDDVVYPHATAHTSLTRARHTHAQNNLESRANFAHLTANPCSYSDLRNAPTDNGAQRAAAGHQVLGAAEASRVSLATRSSSAKLRTKSARYHGQ